MSRKVALLLVLVFLTVSCLVTVKTARSSINAAENSWALNAPMHEARADLGVAVLNGRIYAIGGSLGKGVVTGINEEYDPDADRWDFKASMPTPRADLAIASYQNKIYCIGGLGQNGEISSSEPTASGANEAYNPETDSWETRTPMSTPRYGVEACVVGGKIYVLGGGSNATEVYDPETDHWSPKASMPVETYLYRSWSCASAVVDNRIYVMGLGYISGKGVAYTEIYDPKSDSWSSGAEWPSGGTFGVAGATTGVNAPKRIYVFGADALHWELIPLNIKNIIFNLEKDSWTTGTPMLTPRINVAVAVVKDMLYVIGGETLGLVESTSPSAVNEQYTPVGYGTAHGSATPVDDVAPEITLLSPENKTYNTTELPLNFNVNESGPWMRYKLDASTVVELDGNTTITGLSPGTHSLTVYATDAAGNTGASETITFSIAEPFPTAMVSVASGASAIAIATGLLIYFKKHKRKDDPS